MNEAATHNESSNDAVPFQDNDNQANSVVLPESNVTELTGYEADKYGNENRIFHWLGLDNWNLTEATLIIMDIDPERKVMNKRNKFEYVMTFKGQAYPNLDILDNYIETFVDESGNLFIDGETELHEYQRKYDDLHRSLLKPGVAYAKPSDWIGRALNKGIDIPWIQLAIKNSFYKPKRHYENVNPLNADAELLESERTSLLKIILALAKNGYKYPNRGALAEILKDFQRNANGVAPNTLSDYLKMAEQHFPCKPRQS